MSGPSCEGINGMSFSCHIHYCTVPTTETLLKACWEHREFWDLDLKRGEARKETLMRHLHWIPSGDGEEGGKVRALHWTPSGDFYAVVCG